MILKRKSGDHVGTIRWWNQTLRQYPACSLSLCCLHKLGVLY